MPSQVVAMLCWRSQLLGGLADGRPPNRVATVTQKVSLAERAWLLCYDSSAMSRLRRRRNKLGIDSRYPVGPAPTDAHRSAGYTIVELMITVAIVGVLAALAIFGVQAYIQGSKTASVKQKVGAIARSAVAAYERGHTGADAVALGVDSGAQHALCGSATWVPNSLAKVAGRKYQPSMQAGQDFQSGDEATGWRCLRFEVAQPISYRYDYSLNTNDFSNTLSPPYFVARGEGDVDADGIVARFQRGGEPQGDTVQVQTALWMQNEDE